MNTATEPVPTTADALAELLRGHGIEHVFGQSLPSALMLAAEAAGIRQVFYRAENAGATMADGYARVSGRIGVVGAQNGPAAALLVAPLAEAMKVSVPLLAFVQEVPRSARDRNAFQELDHEALFGACSKWIARLDDPARLSSDLALALTHAVSGRPGPVVLLVPKDVLSAPAAVPRDPHRRASLDRFPLDRPRPERDRVTAAARALAQASNPLVVAGGGVHLSGASARLAELQELASLPVATTTMGKGAFAETHELSLGVAGSFMGRRSLTRSQRALIESADVVLLVGTRTNENGTDSWTLYPEDATFVHLDLAPEEVGRNYESIRLVGDARAGLEDLIEALLALDLSERANARPLLSQRIAQARAQDRAAAAAVAASASTPVRPERLMAELDALLTDDAIVVADASYSTIWAAAYLTVRRPGQRFLSPRGLAGLGWGLPLALGAKVAAPGAPVVCIAGDGGFGHTWAELETAVREQLPVLVLVLDNGILGYQKHAELIGFGAHSSASELGSTDHVAIARACGAQAVRIEDPDALPDALATALGDQRTWLIEVATDPDAYPPITSWDDNSILADPVLAS